MQTLFILQQTIIKNDPSAACFAAHATQKPNISDRFTFFETSATALCGTSGIN
jgi:hypothetical protein